MSDITLILHGYGGNAPQHWQEYLYKHLTDAGVDVRYPRMPAPEDPELDAWLTVLDTSLRAIPQGSQVTVAAHSLGCILWMHYAAAKNIPIQADRVLLVSPPSRTLADLPEEFAPKLAAFYPPPLSAEGVALAGRETVIVASDTDDLTTYPQAQSTAKTLGIESFLMPGAGHISPYYGYGEWPWVVDWCLRRAALPPELRPDP